MVLAPPLRFLPCWVLSDRLYLHVCATHLHVIWGLHWDISPLQSKTGGKPVVPKRLYTQRGHSSVTDTHDGLLTTPGLSSFCSHYAVNQSRPQCFCAAGSVTDTPNSTHGCPVHAAPATIPRGLSAHKHTRQEGGEGSEDTHPCFCSVR